MHLEPIKHFPNEMYNGKPRTSFKSTHTFQEMSLMESQFSNHWKMTNISMLSSKVAHDLVSNFKWGSPALKEILSTVLPDLMRVEGRDDTECLTHLGLRTVNELLTWEVLFQVISQNSWSILALVCSHWSRGKCHHFSVWEQG